MKKERTRQKEYFEKMAMLTPEHQEEIFKYIDLHLSVQHQEDLERKLHPERGQIVNFKRGLPDEKQNRQEKRTHKND